MRQFRSTLFLFLLTLLFSSGLWIKAYERGVAENHTDMDANDLSEPDLLYGFDKNTYHIVEQNILPNQILPDLLLPYGIGYGDMLRVVEKAKDVFDVRELRANKPYALIASGPCDAPEYMVYKPSAYRHILFDLSGECPVSVVDADIEVKIEQASGEVTSSLWQSMEDSDLPYSLISQLEDALAWSIDFHHIQQGDTYKVYYERHYINGEHVGIGQLLGVYYENVGKPYYAMYYQSSKYHGFFDEHGRSMKRAFLKAPVAYSRISSPYNLKRRHPILKHVRPHRGTDYAAPYNTPIMAVADGVISKAAYTKNNGKYVKIKHDKVYQTQYLHMNKFAKNIQPGVHVKQGETIGYVGSTGLATGNHVCFRFWKNGKQVDHRKENLPLPEPLPESEIPQYRIFRDSIVAILDNIPVTKVDQLEACHDKSERNPLKS